MPHIPAVLYPAYPIDRPTVKAPIQTREHLEREVRTAFAGVTLGGGLSLRQAEALDDYCNNISEQAYRELPLSEVTDAWNAVPWAELERNNIAHLDPEGWRYYIPALMLSVLQQYEPASMRVIGTLSSLYPKHEPDSYDLLRYDLLSEQQKQVIARYLHALPTLLPLNWQDSKIVERALRNHWKQFLP